MLFGLSGYSLKSVLKPFWPLELSNLRYSISWNCGLALEQEIVDELRELGCGGVR